MNLNSPTPFLNKEPRLPLLTASGREFLGLLQSSSPEITQRVRELFEHLERGLGFPDNPQGKQFQDCFNLLLRYVYPEIMIDLADILYVQHERLMVFVNFDHIHINLQKDPKNLSRGQPLQPLFNQMEWLFHQLANTMKTGTTYLQDPTILRCLAESYSFYLYQTQNFPWENPFENSESMEDHAVLDVATGLTGFSLIHDWTETSPFLILTDKTPFILKALNHYKTLVGKNNVEILDIDFPCSQSIKAPLGAIWVNKFLHHLQREERRYFLQWSFEHLASEGKLKIIDTDLEYQIILQSKNSAFCDKLIPGYLESLVEIETDFCKNLEKDIQETGFSIQHLDVHDYLDETDTYSLYPNDLLKLKFTGIELVAVKHKD